MKVAIKAVLLATSFPLLLFGRSEFSVDLKSKITTLFTTPEFAKATWSCCVSDINSGEEFYGFNARTPLIPASNQKLLVAAAGLLKLGPDYKSRTYFLSDGPIENGELNGNLIISGYGAIHFTSRFSDSNSILDKSAQLDEMLDQFSQRFRRVGIRRIRGEILVDCTDWTDMVENPNYPSAGPLLFHENTVDIEVQNRIIHYCPKMLFGVKVKYQKWNGKQKKVVVNGIKTDTILVNLGKDSSDYWRLDQYSPTKYYKDHIQHALTQRGISVQGQKNPPIGNVNDRYILFYLESLPLQQLLADMGRYSDNLRAETIFLNLGYVVKGKANYQNGRDALLTILKESGPSLNQMSPFDGAGLSRNNQFSSADTIKLLNFMVTSQFKDTFIRCLPVSGESGTLKSKLQKSTLKGRIIAKTGTLAGVTALSGYILKGTEPVVSFSFICNDAPDKQLCWRVMETALETLVGEIEKH